MAFTTPEESMCPAAHVPNAASGSDASLPSHGPGLEACLTPLLLALVQQTAAINRLAHSNEMLVRAMSESEGMDEDEMPRTTYLDGSPVR